MFYDHKSEEVVQDIITECFCPVLEDIEDEYSNLRRGEFLAIYAPFYVASELLVRILDELDDVYLDEESEIELLTQKNTDVLITIAYDGMIFVESARGKSDKLKYSESALSYVYDSFSNKDIEWLASEGESILVFGLDDEYFEDDCDEGNFLEDVDEYNSDFSDGICIDCCDCEDEDCPRKCMAGRKDGEKDDKAEKDKYVEYSKDKDGDLHGFTASKSDGNSYYSCSVYTSDKFSLKDIQSLLQGAGF